MAGQVNTTLLITGKTVGLVRARAEIQSVYRSSQREITQLTSNVQQFGHHTLNAFGIFKGLAIYRGFGMLTQQLGQGLQAAIEFEKAMANVNSLLLVGSEDLKKYSDFAAELGQTLPLTMQMIAEGMYDVVSAGIKGEEQIKKVVRLAGTAAVAGVTDLRSAVQAGIGTMNAFGKSVDDLSHIYDVQFMTVKMGILQYEQLNQVLGRVTATAALAGQQMETAFGALVAISRGGFGGVAFAEGSTRVTRFFQELSDPSAQAKLRELGIAVFDSFGQMRNAIDIVADVNAKLATLTEEARQAQVRQIFTNIRSAQGFQVLSTQIDIWREAQLKGIFSAGAMPSAAEKQLETVSAILVTLQNQFTSAMRVIVENLKPALEAVGTLFTTIGNNIVPVIMMFGTLAARFVVAGIATKMLSINMQKQVFLFEQERLAADLDTLSLERNSLEIKMNTFAKAAATSASIKSAQTNMTRIAAIDGETAAINRQMITNNMHIGQMQMQRLLMVGNIASMLTMAGAMYAMSAGNETAAKVLIGLTMGLSTFSAIMPIVIGLTTAHTSSLTAQGGAGFFAAAGLTAATGGLAAIGIAAGVAVVVGVAAAAMISLSMATDEATASTDSYLDTIGRMDDAQKNLEQNVKSLVDTLVEEGHTLGYITDEVERYVEAQRGLSDVGMADLAGLASQGLMVHEETAIVAPRFAEGKTAESEATKAAKATAELLHLDYEQGLAGDISTIDAAQTQLRGMVTSTNDAIRWMGEQYTTELFGKDFGGALLTMWKDYGIGLRAVSKDQKKVFDNVTTMAKAEAATILEEAKASIAPVGEHIGDKFTPSPWTGSIFHALKLGFAKDIITPVYQTQEQYDTELEVELAEKGYQAILNVTDHYMTIGDKMANVVGKTMAEINEEIKSGVAGWFDSTKGMMEIEDFVDRLINASDALEAAGYDFSGTAVTWDNLGEKWARIQKMWMGLQMMQTISGVLDSMQDIPDMITGQRAIYDTQPTNAATNALSIIEGEAGQQIRDQIAKFSAMQSDVGRHAARALQMQYDQIVRISKQTEQVVTGYEDVTQSFWTGGQEESIQGMQDQLYATMLPILQSMYGDTSSGILEILQGMFGNMGDPGYWDTMFASEEIAQTIAEMAQEFIDIVSGANGISGAMEAFVEHSKSLEDAGFYFKNVAGGWEMLGEEWARIQSYFKVTEMINSFVQSAKMMQEYGVELPAAFETNMYMLMQTMATSVMPDFQGVIEGIVDNIGSANFWEALADGMSNADISQSNSITLAPYIVISERADAEEVVQIVHDSLVEEAKRAGFTWAGG